MSAMVKQRFLAAAARATALRSAAFVVLLGLGSCGGGIYLGFEGVFDESDPYVAIDADEGSARPGETVRILAYATDESGIDRIDFYRYDGDRQVLLGTDEHYPYDLRILVPDDGRTVLHVFVRATDNADNRADSEVIAITVLR